VFLLRRLGIGLDISLIIITFIPRFFYDNTVKEQYKNRNSFKIYLEQG
jgi:hypothetical protein